MKKCIRAVVSGKVQGVYFRAFTQEEGERLNLVGWVRNLPSGEVETLFCGQTDSVSLMLDWLSSGSPHSQVDHVAVYEVTTEETFADFSIRYEH